MGVRGGLDFLPHGPACIGGMIHRPDDPAVTETNPSEDFIKFSAVSYSCRLEALQGVVGDLAQIANVICGVLDLLNGSRTVAQVPVTDCH